MATRRHSRSRSLFPGSSVARLLVMHVFFFIALYLSLRYLSIITLSHLGLM